MTYISKPPQPGSIREQRWKEYNTTIMRSGPIYGKTAYTPNVANVETTLVTGTVKPNIIERNGDVILFGGAGECSATISTKRLRIYIQTTGTLWTPYDITLPALTTWWWFETRGIRRDVSASQYDLNLYIQFAYSGASNVTINRAGVGIDPRDPFTCYATGYSTIGNDIKVDYWNADFIKGQGLQS